MYIREYVYTYMHVYAHTYIQGIGLRFLIALTIPSCRALVGYRRFPHGPSPLALLELQLSLLNWFRPGSVESAVLCKG